MHYSTKKPTTNDELWITNYELGAYGTALLVCLPQRRQGKRGSFRPRQTDRASCEAFTLVGAFPRFVNGA